MARPSIELPEYRKRWVGMLSGARGAATMLTRAVKHDLAKASVEYFIADDGRLNDDGSLMFLDLLTGEIPRVHEYFMPKIEVVHPERFTQLELDLINESYEHPTKGRLRVYQFTPREILDEVADKLEQMEKRLHDKRVGLVRLAKRCPDLDRPMEDQLDRLKPPPRGRRPRGEDRPRPSA
jgi:hypothetical protein